jgi:hypothetical protein
VSDHLVHDICELVVDIAIDYGGCAQLQERDDALLEEVSVVRKAPVEYAVHSNRDLRAFLR